MLKQNTVSGGLGSDLLERVTEYGTTFPKHAVIGIILLVALFAFEMFNFDTTRYALSNLLGPISFAGLGWATILAVAFCAIDFAGLVRLFTPEGEDGEQPKEVWYLMGAWLLGATMNALMTWWAVSLTLLNHEFGNEVLSRAQLLQVVPIFVAVLVWLTRILFIGALTVAGEHLVSFGSKGSGVRTVPATRPGGMSRQSSLLSRRPARALPAEEAVPAVQTQRTRVSRRPVTTGARTAAKKPESPASRRAAPPMRKVEEEKETPAPKRSPQRNGRVRQRPPIPGREISASSRRRN